MFFLKRGTKIGESHTGVSAVLALTRVSQARSGTCVLDFPDISALTYPLSFSPSPPVHYLFTPRDRLRSPWDH